MSVMRHHQHRPAPAKGTAPGKVLARLAICAASLLTTAAAVHAQDAGLPGYRTLPFTLPASTQKLMMVDADGDGLVDLMAISTSGMALYFQRPDSGFDFSQPDTALTLPWASVGWDVGSDASGAGLAILALVEGSRVLRWPLQERRFGAAQEVLSGIVGFAGGGINRLDFVQDLNADGLDDLIIPAAGTLQLYLRDPDEGYRPPVSVLADMRIRSNLFVRQAIERDVGQSLRIPQLQLRDVNGDALPDLISDTDERLDVFLSGLGDDYFPAEPTFSVDRLEIRERLGEFDVDQLDFSNLTGILSLTHEELLEDVDNDGISDLILREGGKVSLFGGTAEGFDFSQPRQVLRSGGNVLTTFLYDEDGDTLKDLWLWRVESVSVGDLFLWLAISGSIDVEAFVYPNEGSSFARRPARQLTVTLRFPSALRLLGAATEIREQIDSVRETVTVPTAVANVSGVSNAQDLLVLLDQQVDIFLNSMESEPPAPEDPFLASLGYSRDQDNYVIDVQRFIDEFTIEQNAELAAVAGRTPDHVVTLPQAMRNGDLKSTDLNGDQLDDVFVFLERNDDTMTGMLLLSTP